MICKHTHGRDCVPSDETICFRCGVLLAASGEAIPAAIDNAVRIEIRAARLSPITVSPAEFSQIEWCGYMEEEEHSRGPFDLNDPAWQAGYLARFIVEHTDGDS